MKYFSILVTSIFFSPLANAGDLELKPNEVAVIEANTGTKVTCLAGTSRNICRIKYGPVKAYGVGSRDVRVAENGLSDRGYPAISEEREGIILTINDQTAYTFGNGDLNRGMDAAKDKIKELEADGFCTFQP